jgi:hypothetical protein
MSQHLKEVQKAAEVLYVQEAIAFAQLRDACKRVGAIRAVLNKLGIWLVSFSDSDCEDVLVEDNSDVDEISIPT